MIRNTFAVLAMLLLASTASANYVGSSVQYFNPTPDNMDFFTVQSSRTLPKGTFKTTLFFDFAENIHYSDSFENNVLQAHLGFGMGLSDRMSFSVVGSGILNYDDEVGGKYTDDKFTYVRAGFKYRFCDCDKGGFAIVANVGYGLMDPDYFVGDDNAFDASITFAYDKMITDRVRFGANLGYRYGNSEDTLIADGSAYATALPAARDGSDLLASVGLNFLINEKWTGVTEIYASLPTDQLFEFTLDDDTFQQKGAEVLLGANYSVSDRMDIGFGGAVGVFSQAANADWRAFLGMGYAFGGAAEDAAFNLSGNTSAPAPAPVKEVVAPAPVKIEDAPVLKEFDVKVKFASGSANLNDAAKAQLSEAGDFIKNNKYRMVFVEGHSDSQGNDDFNKSLSQRRAQMVKIYLSRKYSISSEKIQAVGFGETAPVADNSTAAGRAQNRRVVIKIK